MATIKGHSIIFGNGSTLTNTLSATGSTLNLLQGFDHGTTSDKDETRDADGDVQAVAYYNQRSTASLDLVLSSGTVAGTPSTITAALTPGTTLALVNQQFTPLTDTWIVSDQGMQVTGSNTTAMRARVALEKYDTNSIP